MLAGNEDWPHEEMFFLGENQRNGQRNHQGILQEGSLGLWSFSLKKEEEETLFKRPAPWYSAQDSRWLWQLDLTLVASCIIQRLQTRR